jgi:hypothetical protein
VPTEDTWHTLPGRPLIAGFFHGDLAAGPATARWYDGFLFRVAP